MKRPQSEAIPTSKLYIICEYASEWKEKRDLGPAQPERKRWWSLENESVTLCGSVCAVRCFEWGLRGCIYTFVCGCDCV